MNTCTTSILTAFIFSAPLLANAPEPAPGPAPGPDPAPRLLLEDDSTEGVSLTVYSSADPAGFDPQQFIAQQRLGYDPTFAWQVPGFGVVKEVRTISFPAGRSEVSFTDVAQFIDPTTVAFTDLSDAKTIVLEQNFQFDLVSPSKLLERYLDEQVTVQLFTKNSTELVTGKLLSANQGTLVISTGDGVRIVPQEGAIVSVGDARGLITRPTLVWKVESDRAGERLVRTTYQAGGITWRADYTLVLNENDTRADLSAWVTLLNLSGAAYRDANLKLVAGDVQRVQPPMVKSHVYALGRGAEAAMDMGFEERSFFEYHLYTLPRKTDIAENTTQQITLFPTATEIPVRKVLVFAPTAPFGGQPGNPITDRGYGANSQSKVDVFIRFVNDADSNLGMPLPKGKLRVYKTDEADGTLEFLGEDLIDHTARNEKVSVRLGQAFDVVGERTQTDFTIDTSRRTMTESIKVEIRNRKAEAATVIVREQLYRWTNWEIANASDEYTKVNARTIEWELEVPANGTKTITFQVRYSW